MQKTLPSIMHTSRGEKPRLARPRGSSSLASATVRNTKPMVMATRLRLEWKSRSSSVSTQPARAPRIREPRISSRGFTTTEIMSTVPLPSASAMPKDTAKSTRPTASSRATMGSSRSVRGPLALYWRTTIRVAAGAVAAAMAPRVMAAARLSTSGAARWISTRARSTTTAVSTAWRMPMTMACLPVSRSWERRNSLPMEKAMKPRATSEMRPRLRSSS